VWEHRWSYACSEIGIEVSTLFSAYGGVNWIRTIDVGNPQLSMHSCRETGGSKDVESAVKLFKCFFEEFNRVEPFVYAGELKL